MENLKSSLVVRRSSFVIFCAFNKAIKNTCSYLFLFLVFLLANCGGIGGPPKAAYPGQVTPEIQAEFQKVEEQYRRRSYDYAFAGYQHFIETYPYTELTDEAYYKQGKIFFLTNRFGDAATKFTELAQKSPNPVYQAKGWHMVGYSHFNNSQYDVALSDFEKVAAGSLPAKMRVQYYSLIIESVKLSGTRQDFADFAAVSLLSLYDDYAGQNLKNLQGANIVSYAQAQSLIDVWLDEPMRSTEFPQWMKTYPDVSGKAYVIYKMAKVYYNENNKKQARKYLTHFLKKYPKNPRVSVAGKLLAELGGPTTDFALKKADYKIGVLLPMKGRYESYSRSVLDGIRCAAGEGNICGGDTGIQLIVKDTGFTAESVKLAIEELKNQGVVAIIGPISGNMAIDAGIAATTNKIPIFPITQKTALMSQGDYIFQVGMQPKQQIKALVKAAMDKGYKTFGIYYPNNNYGQTMAGLFADEVKTSGGRITAEAVYRKRAPDPFAEARKLKKSIGRVGKPGKGVGFDALFIPDSYQSINSIVGALEFNGIKDVPLLGTNAWNDPGLTLAIADKFPGSFFIDLYDGSANTKSVKEFKDQFVAGYGRPPRVLEAYGYDIVNMIRYSAAKDGSKRIRDTIAMNGGFNGVTGIKGFSVGEGAVVESMVLKIKATGVKE